MNTCETCKHWKKPEEWSTGYGLGVGRCQNLPMFWDATEWDEEGEGRKFLDKYKDTKAFAQDGSDYLAYLLTKPDFGCVSYKPANAKFKSPAKHLLKRCRKPSFRQHRTMLRGEWWPVPRPPRRPKSPRLQGIVLRWLRDTPF